MTSDMGRRLDRLDLLWRRRPPPRPATDMPALYARLEALGLAYWDEKKGYWSPTNRRLMKELLAELRARRTMGMADNGRQ